MFSTTKLSIGLQGQQDSIRVRPTETEKVVLKSACLKLSENDAKVATVHSMLNQAKKNQATLETKKVTLESEKATLEAKKASLLFALSKVENDQEDIRKQRALLKIRDQEADQKIAAADQKIAAADQKIAAAQQKRAAADQNIAAAQQKRAVILEERKHIYVMTLCQAFGCSFPAANEHDKIKQFMEEYFPKGEIIVEDRKYCLKSMSPIIKFLEKNKNLNITKCNLSCFDVILDFKTLAQYLMNPSNGCKLKAIGVKAQLKELIIKEMEESIGNVEKPFRVSFLETK